MQLLVLIGGIMIFLAFLVMPFSVFGLKGRLDAVEARLDGIQGEIRALALRLPEPGRRGFYEEEALRVPQPEPERAPGRQMAVPRPAVARPPIPPAAWSPDDAPRRPIGAGVQPPARQEPGMVPRREPRFR
jgi:hypothetical protein